MNEVKRVYFIGGGPRDLSVEPLPPNCNKELIIPEFRGMATSPEVIEHVYVVWPTEMKHVFYAVYRGVRSGGAGRTEQ